MTTVPQGIRRILVALDASPGSLAALEMAARIAVALQAELLGLYVEDESLLRGADLSMTKAVGSFSGTLRPLGRTELERHLRTQAAKARRALETTAAQGRLRCSFRIVRGAVAAELLAAAADVDLVSVGRCGWSMLQSRRIGTTTATILSKCHAPVLLLQPGLRVGQSVVVVYDGSDEARIGLRAGGQIAHDEGTPLVLVLTGNAEAARQLKRQAEGDLDALGIKRSIRYRAVPHTDPAILGAVAHSEDAGILILPTKDVLESGFRQMLTRIECPILVVR